MPPAAIASSDTVTISSVSAAGASAAWSRRNVERHRLRELRRAAEAAEAAVELAPEAGDRLVEQRVGQRRTVTAAADARCSRSMAVVQLLGLLAELVAPVAPRVVDGVQERTKPGIPWRSSCGK